MPGAADIAMNADFEARDIRQVSQAEVVAFSAHILESECGLRVRRSLESSVAQFFQRFDPKDRLFLAMFRADAMRTLLAVDRLNAGTAVLKWIFVAPEDRNRGLGGHLIDRAIAFATRAGYGKLVLCTATEMKSAHHLYRKKGFVYVRDVTFWRRRMKLFERAL